MGRRSEQLCVPTGQEYLPRHPLVRPADAPRAGIFLAVVVARRGERPFHLLNRTAPFCTFPTPQLNSTAREAFDTMWTMAISRRR